MTNDDLDWHPIPISEDLRKLFEVIEETKRRIYGPYAEYAKLLRSSPGSTPPPTNRNASSQDHDT